ncbi:MAG: (Fe-S)-binding protein, partial [Chloroflexi bacterium]
MINPLPTSFEKIAVTCGTCHDQCAAACPVVKSSRSLGAYPSRLAMLAFELSRETIPMDRTVLAAMQQCIHCNACTAHCVFIDQPVDITPLIRWSRQQLIENGWATEAMQALAIQADANNNPSGDLQRQMRMLADTPFADGSSPEAVLLLVDAATMQKAPGMVKSALRLLSAIGWRDVRVSSCLDCGGDLFEYGYTAAARACAERIAHEIEHAAVREVITVTAAATHLLRQVYPAELGVSIPTQVRPLSKVLQDAIKPGLLRKNQQERALLVLSTAELYKMKDLCAVEILHTCCQVVN